MEDKVEKIIRKFKALPLLTRVDLEIQAVLHHESWRQEKLDLEKAEPFLVEHLCVHYLRHVWFTQYDTLKNKDRLAPDTYLLLTLRFTEAVEERYPWLAQAAYSQYHRKKRRITFGARNPLDRRLNDMLKLEGYHKPINNWKWYGMPGPLSPKSHVPKTLDLKIMKEIHISDKQECSLSDSEYVTQCKEWLDEKFEDVKAVIHTLSG